MASNSLETFKTWLNARDDFAGEMQDLAVRQADMRKDIKHLGAE